MSSIDDDVEQEDRVLAGPSEASEAALLSLTCRFKRLHILGTFKHEQRDLEIHDSPSARPSYERNGRNGWIYSEAMKWVNF